MRTRSVRAAAATLVAVVMLAGCDRDVLDPYQPIRGVSVGLSWVGGRCPDGACAYSVTISGDRDDGATVWSDDEERTGPADPDATAALFEFVDGSFDDLWDEPFTGTCPTTVDGREVFVEYSQLPVGPGAEFADAIYLTSSTCEHAWPDTFIDDLRPLWEATGSPWPLAPTEG